MRCLGAAICAAFGCAAGGCDWVVGISALPPPTATSDGGVDGTRALDAANHCDGDLVFVPVPASAFPGLSTEYVPTVTDDLAIAFDVEDGNGFDLHEFHRSVDSFTEVDISGLNSPGLEDDPAVTADGLDLFFVSSRTGGMNAYEATRADVGSAWTAANAPMGLNAAVIISLDVSPDGLTLYLVDVNHDLYQATRPSRAGVFMIESGPPKATNVRYPTISSDGLELITEVATGPAGLYEATRPIATGPNSTFSTPGPIPTLGTAYDADLSPDNHYLMTGGANYYVRSCQ